MPKKLTDIIGNLPRVFTDQQGNNITVAPTENRRIAVLSDEQIVAVGAFVEVIKKIHISNAPFKKDCINRFIEGKLPENNDNSISYDSIQGDLNELTAGRKRILDITQIFVNYSKRFLNTQIQPWEKDDHWIVGEKTRKLAKLEKDISADNIVTVVQMAMALKDVSEKLLNDKIEAEKRIADKKHLSEEDKKALEVFFEKLKHFKIPPNSQALIYIVEKALNDLNKKYLVNKNSIFCHLRYALTQNDFINDSHCDIITATNEQTLEKNNPFSTAILEVLEQFHPGFSLSFMNSYLKENGVNQAQTEEMTSIQNEQVKTESIRTNRTQNNYLSKKIEFSKKIEPSKKDVKQNQNKTSTPTKTLTTSIKQEFPDEIPIFEVLNDPIKNNYVPTTFEKFKTNCGVKTHFKAKPPMPWGQKLRMAIEETKRNCKKDGNNFQHESSVIQKTIVIDSEFTQIISNEKSSENINNISSENLIETSDKTECGFTSKNDDKCPETINLVTQVEEQIKLIRSVWNNQQTQ